MPGTPLKDSQGRSHDYLRISLTRRCNLHCSYCRPVDGVCCTDRKANDLNNDELLELVAILAGMGVNKVRLTGGEPLIRRGIEEIVGGIAATQGIETVAMTTNGTLLRSGLDELCRAGLSRINISLDSLKPPVLKKITGVNCFDRVWSGIQAALSHPGLAVKLNTVVVRDVNDGELLDFVELTREWPVDIRFIEYMPFDGNRWEPEKLVGWQEMLDRIGQKFKLAPDGDSGVARMYRVDGFAGRIGFIAPLTGCFCGSCRRLRLTSDGHLRLCLHHPDELDLGGMLRSGISRTQLEQAVLESLRNKPASHGRIDSEAGVARACASMVSIGG